MNSLPQPFWLQWAESALPVLALQLLSKGALGFHSFYLGWVSIGMMTGGPARA